MKRLIYLDHAATTPLDPRVLTAMKPFFIGEFGNPSALYDLGVQARQAIDASRKSIAEILHTTADTVAFTSGGTESNNLAILGVARQMLSAAHTTANPSTPPLGKGRISKSPPFQGGVGVVAGVKASRGRIITTPIEHDSVLGPIKKLEQEGWEVTYVSVDKYGLVNPQDVIRAIRPETVLISVMYANNEIGIIEPIAEIGRMILRYRKEHNSPYPYFHTDACQAANYLDIDVEKLHVDLMTINGSKIYGPKGTGLLYVRRGVKLEPLFYGGQQEHSLRPGTENVAGIVGLAKALALAQAPSPNKGEDGGGGLRKLTKYFWSQLQEKVSNVKLNGPEIDEQRLPNNLNIEFPGIEGEALLLYLNEAGIMCSTSSACGLESSEPSHVLSAIELLPERVRGSVRFSLGHSIKKNDVDYAINQLVSILKLLRGRN